MNSQLIYAVMYLEINIVAVVLVGMIHYKTNGISRMVAQRNFAMSIAAEIVFFLSDTAFVMIVHGLLPYSRAGMMLCKELYFFATTLMCFFWFVYFEYFQESPFVENRRRIRIASVLVWIMAVLLIVNIFTGILFYVDENGGYHRGRLFIIQYILPYLYVLTTCMRAFIGIFDKKKYAKRKQLIKLALFPVAPAGAGILQFLYPELPLACATLAIATLMMYLDWVDRMISVDPLTRLNNRKQLLYHYEHWRTASDENALIYLLMIDANKFKSINDTYGHIEGDNALLRIAEALRMACHNYKRRTNIARYGGDEFVILVWADDEEDIIGLIKRIHDKLDALNEQADAPYELTVSIGYSKVSSRLSLDEVIEEADVMLYKEKERS